MGDQDKPVTLAELAGEAKGKEAEEKPAEEGGGEEKLLLGRFKSEDELAEYIRGLEEKAKGKETEEEGEEEAEEEAEEEEGEKRAEAKPLSDEERQKLNESYLEDFYADPIGTNLKLVTAVVRQVIQNELLPVLQPLQEYVSTSSTQAELDRIAREVAKENDDFGDHVEEMEEVFKQHPELVRMGKAGFELALSRARDLKARKARATAGKEAVGLSFGSRPAGTGKVSTEDLFRRAIREAAPKIQL